MITTIGRRRKHSGARIAWCAWIKAQTHEHTHRLRARSRAKMTEWINETPPYRHVYRYMTIRFKINASKIRKQSFCCEYIVLCVHCVGFVYIYFWFWTMQTPLSFTLTLCVWVYLYHSLKLTDEQTDSNELRTNRHCTHTHTHRDRRNNEKKLNCKDHE